ncbi:MAG: hypothetical protein JNL05_04150 [Flavobacteriales bacterium]|nr:hypothetical protein [Flavobacteriales bacterium]
MRLSILSLLALPLALSAQTTDVLFLGNSYVATNDLPGVLRQLALSLGDSVNTAQSTPGGYTFQGHTTLAASQQLIDQGGWDFVVLQEQSQIPSFPLSQVQADCFPFAAELVDSIRVHSPCAEPVFYMTWGRQNGDASNCANWPPVCTFEGMNGLLRERYLTMAVDNDAWCAPVGVAWKNSRDQQPAINLYSTDGSHPSPAGTYLTACTFYAALFRESPVGAGYTAGLDPTTAAALQAIAASTVLDSLGTWNIGVNDPDASFTTSNNGASVSFTPNNGAGYHTWIFGDGTTDNSTVTNHTFPASGLYEVMHIVVDDCGRADTAIVPVNVVISSMPEEGGTGETVIAFNQLKLHNGQWWYTAEGEGTLDLYGTDGRLLDQARLGALQTWSRWCRLPSTTVVLWRFTGVNGDVRQGRLLVP